MSADVRFLQRGREETVPAGKKIFAFNDPCAGGDIFYVIAGRVRLTSTARDVTISQKVAEAGAVFGVEEPYAGERHRMHEAEALADTRLYRWDRKAFDEAMGIYQELATQVIKDLSGYLRKVNRGGTVPPRG